VLSDLTGMNARRRRIDERPSAAMALMGVSLLFGRIVAILFVIFLAKFVVPEQYGEFRALLSIATLAAFFSDSGPVTYSARMISSHWHDKHEVARIIDTTLFIQLIFIIITVLILFFFGYYRLDIYILLISMVALDYISSILRGENKFTSTSIFQVSNAIIKLLLLIIVGYTLSSAMDALTISILYSASIVPAIAILLFVEKRIPRLPRFFSYSYVKSAMKFSLPVVAMTFAHYSTINLAIPFVQAYYGSLNASYLSVAFTFGSIVAFVPSAINFVIMPTVAKEKDRIRIMKSLSYYSILTLIICGIAFIALLIFPDLAITILFSSDFLPSKAYFPVVLAAFLLLALTTIFDAVWVGVGNLRVPMLTSTIGAIINIICISISILNYTGPEGIALAFFISRLSIFILMLVITLHKKEFLISAEMRDQEVYDLIRNQEIND